MMVAGGVESAIDGVSLGGFCRLRALATKWNDDPTGASRPFDAARAGFVMGEGAGVVVLEELQHALDRNAPHIHAEVHHEIWKPYNSTRKVQPLTSIQRCTRRFESTTTVRAKCMLQYRRISW